MGRTDAGWKIGSNILKLSLKKFLAYDFSGALKNSRYITVGMRINEIRRLECLQGSLVKLWTVQRDKAVVSTQPYRIPRLSLLSWHWIQSWYAWCFLLFLFSSLSFFFPPSPSLPPIFPGSHLPTPCSHPVSSYLLEIHFFSHVC